LAAIQSALSDPSTYGYTLFHDTAEFRVCLRQVVPEEVRPGVIDPETEVLPLIGSQQGTALLPLALLNPGDVALVADPGLSLSRGRDPSGGRDPLLPAPAGGKPLLAPAGMRSRQAICRQARLLVLNYPHNPTTATVTPEFWQETLQFCQQYDIVLAHDFPYVDWRFDGQVAPSALQADPDKTRTIEFFSLSKSYHMGGFRVAYAIGSRELIRALRLVKSTIDFHQYQGILAGGSSSLDSSRQLFAALAAGIPRATGYSRGGSAPHRLACALARSHHVSVGASAGVLSRLFCSVLSGLGDEPPGLPCLPVLALAPGGEGYVRFALVVRGIPSGGGDRTDWGILRQRHFLSPAGIVA
jgi:aspartate/methionine/tyrosine aminotransferase